MKNERLKDSITHKIYESKKTKKDNFYKMSLFVISLIVIFFIASIIFLLFVKGLSGFFKFKNFHFVDFLFGNYYNPTSNAFAAGFMIINTLWISALALLIAIPISIFTALFISRIIPKKFKSIFFVVISILAAIPSVIYGAFGLFVIDSVIRGIFSVPPGTVLTVIVTLSFMIMPTITILSISAIDSVDKKMEQSALALGATKIQTSFMVTLKSAQKGIFVAILLGLGRVLGEATAVSMIASQSSYGPTFNPLGFIALITSTMLQGFPEVASGSIEQASMISMAALLLITILIIFLALKQIEIRIDVNYKAKKSLKKIETIKEITQKVESNGIESLTKKETLNYYLESKSKIDYKKDLEAKTSYKIFQIMSNNSYFGNTSIKSHKYKTKKSNLKRIVTFLFALIGIVLLSSILYFLFSGGFSVLNWKYISSKGIYKVVDYQNIYGLSTPLFGTIFTILISLLISLPIGISIAILISVYLKKDSKFSNIIGFFVQILTGIPSLIYGIIGSIIFVPLFSNKILHLNSISAALTISLFILPTILKTTQEGFDSIHRSQKMGSLALGGTNLITIKKVLFKQALPYIVSSAVLAAGLVIADSAIFITIYGTLSQNDSMSWIQNGGTTLSSEIYKLTKQEVILWNYVKAIGIVIIFLIISISFLANFIKEAKWREVSLLLFGLLFIFIGIFQNVFIIFIIGFILFLLSLFAFSVWNYLNKKFKLYNKIKSKFLEIKIGV